MSSEAKPLEVSVSSSVGGKVQIIKFEYSEDYHFSQTEKWSVPEDWTEEQVAEYVAGLNLNKAKLILKGRVLLFPKLCYN